MNLQLHLTREITTLWIEEIDVDARICRYAIRILADGGLVSLARVMCFMYGFEKEDLPQNWIFP